MSKTKNQYMRDAVEAPWSRGRDANGRYYPEDSPDSAKIRVLMCFRLDPAAVQALKSGAKSRDMCRSRLLDQIILDALG